MTKSDKTANFPNKSKWKKEKSKFRKIRKKKLKNFSLSSLLLLSTSLGGTVYAMETLTPEPFPQQYININGTTIAYEDFIDALKKENGTWYARYASNKKLNFNRSTNYTIIGDERHNQCQGIAGTKTVIDTINVTYDKKSKNIYYHYNIRDSITDLPSMGFFNNWDRITVRYFQAEDEDLQNVLNVYNDKYNATEEHEGQHFKNMKAGLLRCGQSYETKFSEQCMDEVAANLKQFLKQRQNYIENRYNRDFITERFSFYYAWLDSNPQPSEKISSEEAAFIINSIFDSWKKEKFDIYLAGNVSRTRYTLSKINYAGIIDHPQQHKELMKAMFTQNGINFYQYIEGREQEFIEMLPNETKQTFAELTQKKKDAMNYFTSVDLATDNDDSKKDAYVLAQKNNLKNYRMKQAWNSLKSKITGK